MSHLVWYAEVGAISEKNAVYSTSTLRYRAPKNQINLKKHAMLNNHTQVNTREAVTLKINK